MLANLRAGFARHKTTLAIVGAVAVAGLAFIARKRSTASTASTSNTTTGTTYSAGAGTSSSTPYSTSTPYDSTGQDIASALQANTEALQQLLNTTPVPDPNAAPTPATTTPVTPAATAPASTTPAAPAAAAPLVNMGLVKNPNGATIYERRSDNSLRAIPYAEWSGAGFPGFNVVASSDPLWASAKYV